MQFMDVAELLLTWLDDEDSDLVERKFADRPRTMRSVTIGKRRTGRSRVIKAIREMFAVAEKAHWLAIVATTGCAAVLINGSTVDSFAGLRCGSKRTVQKAQRGM